MGVQSTRLSLVALGVDHDAPPALQPLAGGVHLRWMPSRAAGFPPTGFFLFWRAHLSEKDAQPKRQQFWFDAASLTRSPPGPRAATFAGGRIASTGSLFIIGGEVG